MKIKNDFNIEEEGGEEGVLGERGERGKIERRGSL